MKKILLFLIAIITVSNLFAKDVSPVKKLKSATIKTPTKKYAVGGPDTYGYTWLDSDESGYSYAWQDISSTGTDLEPGIDDDDAVFGPFSIGFDFPFYDTTYDEFYFETNGSLFFEDGYVDYHYYPIPSSDVSDIQSFIAWHWRDLEMLSDNDAAVYAQAFDGYTIIQFENYSDYDDSDYIATMQVVLYENGNIELRYNSIDPSGYYDEEFSVGIQKDDTDGLQVAYDDDSFFEDGKSVLIKNPNAAEPVPFSIYTVFALFVLTGGLTVFKLRKKIFVAA